MKKYLFIALAAAGMLSSCSSDDTVANNSEDLVPIKIGMGNIATNVTRGTGTVGASGATVTNQWNGELVNIYMFDQGTLNLAQNLGTAIYDNEEFQTPAGEDGSTTFATATSGAVKFYPASGNFDFFGYRTDGAETAAPALNTAGDAYVAPITIDGSQDVMGAQCDKTAAAAALDAAAGTTGTTKFFSAYAARKGVQPELIFKHLLSRLTFEVKAGNSNASAAGFAVEITDIRVKSNATGELYVASAADGFEPKIEWATVTDPATEYATLTLKSNVDADADGNLDALAPFSLEGNTAFAHVGEALLVAPGDATYSLEIAMKQKKIIDPVAYAADPTTGWTEIVMDPYKTNIVIPSPADDPATPEDESLLPGAAKAGSSYNVQIVIYGLEEIQVKTVLSAWENGGTISIDPDANI